MKRRLFNLAALLSTILCLACVVLWVRSGCYRFELYVSQRQTSGVAVGSIGSSLSVIVDRLNPVSPDVRMGCWERLAVPRPSWQLWWGRPQYEVLAARRTLLLPYWLLTLMSGVLPALWFWRRRKHKRQARRRGFEVAVEKPSNAEYG